MSPTAGLTLGLIMLAGNAFFVGAEFALVSARRSNIELRALSGSRLAKVTLAGMEQVSLMLAGAQLGVTLCSLVFGAVSEPVVAHMLEPVLHAAGLPDAMLHPVSFVIALSLMVYLHVVLGEMVPKNLALASSTRSALALVPPLWYIIKIIRPLVVGLNMIANGCIRLIGIKPRQEIRSSFSRDEVAGFVRESHKHGLLSHEEQSLLTGALSFDERPVAGVVVALESLRTTSVSPSASEVESLSGETGFSRFPVSDGKGGLKGYVHLKDMLQIPDELHDEPLGRTLIRPLGSVRPDATLRDALAAMRLSGAHIVKVQDGRKLLGAVMLEDVLEELVGTIKDSTTRS